CSGCRATPSRPSSVVSCSSFRRCDDSRERQGPARASRLGSLRGRLPATRGGASWGGRAPPAMRGGWCSHPPPGKRRTRWPAVAGQESHMIARAAEANALVLVPKGEGEIERGSRVRYLRLEAPG